MWPPSDVVDKHKTRASFIWISFLGLIIGYSAWLVVSTNEKRKNPTVSLRLEEDRYAFPTISICAYAGGAVGKGCDSEYLDCATSMYSSAHSFIGFNSSNGETYVSVSKLNERFPEECIDLDLSNITEIENDSAFYPPRIVFGTTWIPSLGFSDTVEESSESVAVFFTDPDISNPMGDHNMSTFAGSVPFTRQRAGNITTTFLETEVTMTLTESVTLDGENTKTYSAGTISSQFYEVPDGMTNETYPVDIAYMFMHVLQPALTHTIRREVDPLEWAELVGSIGGTWELLLLLWGIFFIAKRNNEPQMKGRNLVKSVKQGAQTIARGATSIATLSARRNSTISPASEDDEVVPAWSAEESKRAGDGAPRPPLAFDFGGGQTRLSGFFSTNHAAGGQAQDLRDVNFHSKSSEHGVNHAPSRGVPEVDDIPRPAHRPL